MTSATAIDVRQGLALTGEFLSVTAGRRWQGRDGEWRDPFVVKLLARDATVIIEYRDAASAEAAVRESAGGDLPMRGDVVTLPVFARAKGKDWLAYSGLNLRDGAA